MITFLSLVVCIVGGAIYCLTDRKGAELGRLAFVVGLFIFLSQGGPWLLSLVR